MRIGVTFRALRHRNFRLFFGGQLISLVGTWMQSVAQSWLIYRLTGSPALLGAVGFTSQFPVFLLAPIGGIVADRFRRQVLLIITQTSAMILASLLAALTLTGHIRIWHIFVLGAALGVVNAFDIPIRQSFIVDMVDRHDLMNAIALNSAMFNGARVVGPALAGLLVSTIGEGWCFGANAISYLAVIAGLMRMRTAPGAARYASGSALAHVLEGFRFVAHTPPIRALLLLLALVSLIAMPYVVLMPIFADQILHSGARGLGILMAASGVGAVAGALAVASRREVRGLGLWVAVSMGGLGLGLISFALSRSFWLSATLLVPVGTFMMVQMSASNTLIQAMVPDALRGRVMAIYSMMFMGMAPVGALLAGSLASHVGAPLMVATGGALATVGAVSFYLRLPALRPAAQQLLVSQDAEAGTAPADGKGMAGGPPTSAGRRRAPA